MRCMPPIRPATLLLLTSCVSLGLVGAPGGCVTTSEVTPKTAVQLPPAPAFMGPCPASSAAPGMPPNAAFDAEHLAFKDCSRRGGSSRAWYEGVRKRYGGAQLEVAQ
jgi:hypothetical protein